MGRGKCLKQFLAALLPAFVFASCSPPTAVPTTSFPPAANMLITNPPVQADLPAGGESALLHIKFLADGIGARPAGTEKEAQTAHYILQSLQEIGYTPDILPFTATTKTGLIHSVNVIAVKPGSSQQEIIVGAHYDSVGAGMGADDNASGVGVLLEVARWIKDRPTPYTIRFIFFGSEEAGLEGSKFYAGQMTEASVINTIAMINLDSLIAGNVAYVYGDAGDKGLIRDWSLRYAKNHGLELQTQPGTNLDDPAGTTGDWSDHAPFKAKGIPYTYFESTDWKLGNQDGYTQVDPQYGQNGSIWHTRFDNLQYINSTFPGRIPARLSLFATVLEGILTEYRQP